jgi:hypothetical protein
MIKYNGSVYIEATPIPHKRCAEGTHWNEKHQKCMEIPASLLHASQKAFALSKSIGKAPKNVRSWHPAYKKWEDKHKAAADAHRSVLKKLRARGFGVHTHPGSDLVAQHLNMRDHHWDLAHQFNFLA